jgi:hemerythrin
MDEEQRAFILSEYKRLIDAYDNNTNKYAAIAAILRALADTESEHFTAEGYEEYKVDAVYTTTIYHIASLLEELK